MSFLLNYDDSIHLDAETLAEGGIAAAYESVLPRLRQFVKNTARIEEYRDDDKPSYSVRCEGIEYHIYSPELEEQNVESWGRATVALFAIINEQLKDSTHRFYAINGGNDLCGIFLTLAESEASRNSLPNRRDWPYLPVDEDPWYGMYH